MQFGACRGERPSRGKLCVELQDRGIQGGNKQDESVFLCELERSQFQLRRPGDGVGFAKIEGHRAKEFGP